MSLRVTMLGCGTSTGVPVIGCDCPVCTSDHPRNQRLRSALRIDLDGGVVIVDTTPDFRQQALQSRLRRVDAVLYTHSHADHIYGLDDLRIFNFIQRSSIPCYGNAETLAALRRHFFYIFDGARVEGGGIPHLELIAVDGPFRLLGREIVPVPVLHGSLQVLGFRIGAFAYVTDCSEIPEESFALLEGVEILILDALRYRPHSTHLSVSEAIAAAGRIGARRTYLTHLAHEIDYLAPKVPMPAGVEFGYDGLVLDVE